jgi:16S rRNA (adenine1518-N6/adenine1519-N6)-dimethyltransferase
MKKLVEVPRRCRGDLLRRFAKTLRQNLRRARHHSGLIALAAVGRRSKPGSVGLNQDAVERHASSNIAERLRFRVCDVSSEGNKEPKVERAPSLLPSASKAVHDTAKARSSPELVQNQEDIVPGVRRFVGSAAMDEDWALACSGDFKLADQALALHIARRALVIVVKTDLAAGNDFRLGKKGIKLGQGGLIGFNGAVGIDACAGVEARQVRPTVELATEIACLVHFRWSFANADGENCAHARLPRPLEHLFAIISVARAVEVGVRVDEQGNLRGGGENVGCNKFSLVHRIDRNARRACGDGWPGQLPSEQHMLQKPKLGQNFLVDAQAARKIASSLGDVAGRTVVEVGPGRGAITGELAARAGHVVAIELDRELAADLRRQFEPTRVTVLEQDVLQFDFAAAAAQAGGRLRVAGNLPYYITSPILRKLAESHAAIELAVLMVQREVANRVTAAPGSRDYGLLSATVQMYGPVEPLFTLPPAAFSPRPQVYSAVFRWRFEPRFADQGVEETGFLRVLQQVFAQKRKTLANNLRSAGIAPAMVAASLERAGIEPNARAEAVGLEKLAVLWRALKSSL